MIELVERGTKSDVRDSGQQNSRRHSRVAAILPMKFECGSATRVEMPTLRRQLRARGIPWFCYCDCRSIKNPRNAGQETGKDWVQHYESYWLEVMNCAASLRWLASLASPMASISTGGANFGSPFMSQSSQKHSRTVSTAISYTWKKTVAQM